MRAARKISIIIGLLFPLTCSFYGALTRGLINSVLLFILSIVLIVLITTVDIRYISLTNLNKIVVLLFSLVVIDMLVRGNETSNELFQYLLLIAFILFLSQSSEWVAFIINIAELVGVFYAITVILEVVFPVQFVSFAKGLLISNQFESFLAQQSWGFNCGLTTQVSIVGCYLAMGACAVIAKYLMSPKNEKGIRIGLLVEFLILFFAMLMTGKRASIIFVILSFIMTYYSLNSYNATRRLKTITLIVMAIGLTYLFLITVAINIDLGPFTTLGRILSTTDRNSALNGRSGYYSVFVEIFELNPIFGVGWENFRKIAGYTFNCHNIYIQMIAELGILIGGAIIICLMYCVVLMRRYVVSIHIKKYSKKPSVSLIFSFMTLCFFLLYGVAENPMYDTEYIAMLTISLSVFFATQKEIHRDVSIYTNKEEVID